MKCNYSNYHKTLIRKKVYNNGNLQKQTDYIGNFIYEDSDLKYILTNNGRIVVDGINYNYQYFVKDHLGNTRATIDAAGAVLQEDSYYAFGMAMNGQSLPDMDNRDDTKNNYLYNGKEMQEELDWYDYGARFYDATLGRWHSLDPKLEKYFEYSPYNYCANNPLKFIDSNGEENIIYLMDLRLNDKNTSEADKKKYLNNLINIALKATKGFAAKGLPMNVKILLGAVPSANKLDNSDVLATIGTASQLKQFDEQYASAYKKREDEKYDLVGSYNAIDKSTINEGNGGNDEGDRIALPVEYFKEMEKYGISENDYIAWAIQHGAGHNAAIQHSDDMKPNFVSIRARDNQGGWDLMTSGDAATANDESINRWKKTMNNVGTNMRVLFYRTKFVPRPAKDNLKR